jgi:hypothetical protein
MAASDYVPIFFKYRLHLAGRPQMSTRSTRLGYLIVLQKLPWLDAKPLCDAGNIVD